ncbi:methyltransferase domain-containing protein [Geminicoccus roseus]|uniref:methyltransferase domain-containing protein n=1 Tax=Geminicoccus roseus TaxID=404900 RepID=UPI00054FAD5F|nr:methyltransferase domain-containing protein [Geminicoccus roseus]
MEHEERAESRSESSAEVFERLFLPAMAGPWAVRVADAARLGPGDRVLDVACGTGAVAAEALRRVGPDGSVTGLDRSPDMLAVARRKLPDLDWHEGRAEALPFDDAAFDAVTCQFGMMFFDDPGQALQEMRRVLRAGGRVALAVWDRLDRTPGYAMLTDLVERHLGREAGMPIRASFALGDADRIRSLLETAAFVDVEAASVDATARFPSIEDWVEAEVRGWVGGEFGDKAYAALLDDARHALAGYERQDGSVEFALPAIVGTASTRN